jgi:hypothetical protein
MPYQATYTLGGPFPPMLVEFVDRNTYLTWKTHVDRVKALDSSVPNGSANQGAYQPFLFGVRDLRGVWGGILVPEDVKSALLRVEQRLGLPVTQWEEGERYHSPTVIDATHFGPFPAGFAGVNHANRAGANNAN